MVVVGINFTDISAKKEKTASGKISVNNNIVIKNVEKAGKEKELIKVDFSASTKYEPGVGEIMISGYLLWLPTGKKDIAKEWKEKKKLPKEVAEPVLNAIINRATIESLLLAKEVGLPSPIKLPRLKVKA